ncbi:type III secretion system stator protein SctL [Pokkaliibacter sp. CJK22405]|uniref:type III secretion system stator protein SctL n=1 Tax=Pokkaliibacter sp. CJK22405 TaxID=3384615 RepID=UPI00398562FE
MMIKRRLSAGSADPVMVAGLLKGSTLQGWVDSEAILDKAKAEARHLLEQAESEAERIRAEVQEKADHWLGDYREQASAEFWSQANAMQESWEAQHQALWGEVENILEPLLKQSLKKILQEVPAEERIRSVVRQLIAAKPSFGSEVRCAPESQAPIAELLAPYGDRWKLVPDALVSREEIVFTSSAGSFTCDWKSIVTELTGATEEGQGEDDSE